MPPLPSQNPDPRVAARLSADSVAATLRDLVAIDSANPDYGGPAGGEARVAARVADFLRALGLAPELRDAMPGRPNLTARLRGADSSRTTLFFTHSDTVSTEGMSVDPFGAEIRDGRLWGRGSTDAKGQAAAMLHALAAVVESGATPPTDILFALTCDEESGFGGVRALVEAIARPDAVVVGEPTDLAVVVAHKGTIRRWFEVEGRSAHSSKPHLGINAIRRAAEIVRAIEDDLAKELALRSHPLLGSPTINVSKIEGGTQVNLVPARCRVLLDRRTLPGETRETADAELLAVFDRVRGRFPDLVARAEAPFMVDPPLETDPESPLARAACAVAAAHGREGRPQGAPYGTDGSKFSAAGVPTIVVGPGSIDQAHTRDEFVELSELEAGARYYFDLMTTDLAR